MLMAESERAGLLRKAILDIVIDTINARTGGGTKYINQRDEDFIHSAFLEENYRKQFSDALRDWVDMGNFKYAVYTDKIYVSIFREKSREYRRILNLNAKESVRETFYSEILDLVASYECGFADALAREAKAKGRKLTPGEVDSLFKVFESQAHWTAADRKGPGEDGQPGPRLSRCPSSIPHSNRPSRPTSKPSM